MSISVQAQAVLLLTARFAKLAKGEPKPLSVAEWGRFALWLKNKGLAPEVILAEGNPGKQLVGWTDRTVTPERIDGLLARSGALGLALEKWERAGLWVMTRSDPDYPTRLKRRLKFDAPPVLFGCGNRQLLDGGGVAIVGSRDASDENLTYTGRLGGEVALQGYSVVSGGARGVDETAMLAALDKEGTVIGIMADSLLRAATSAKYRKGLMAKNLVLVSPFNPEAGFDVGNAMARNKYIYCLADAAVVVATSKGKGGTWTGAIENLDQGWVPLWVKAHISTDSGSAALVARGGHWLPDDDAGLDVARLVDPSATAPTDLQQETGNLLETPQPLPESTMVEGHEVRDSEPEATYVPVSPLNAETTPADQLPAGPVSFYELFLHRLGEETSSSPATPEALAEKLELNKTQLNDWLKRALKENRLVKLNKPVRYQIKSQGSLGI